MEFFYSPAFLAAESSVSNLIQHRFAREIRVATATNKWQESSGIANLHHLEKSSRPNNLSQQIHLPYHHQFGLPFARAYSMVAIGTRSSSCSTALMATAAITYYLSSRGESDTTQTFHDENHSLRFTRLSSKPKSHNKTTNMQNA